MKIITNVFFVLLLSLSSSAFAEKLNINTADAATIATIMTGVGESRAQAIIDYRTANGQFHSLEDLTKVKGVSDKTLEKNLDNISL